MIFKTLHSANIDHGQRKRKHTLFVCAPLKPEDTNNSTSLSMETQVSANATNVQLGQLEDRMKTNAVFINGSECSVNQQQDCETGPPFCSSAKQCRKMSGSDVSGTGKLSWKWEQTNSSVAVTLFVNDRSEEETRAYDISFTSTTATIISPGNQDSKYEIHFFDAIVKDKSQVQIKKRNIILRVVKEKASMWPSLETPSVQLMDNSKEEPEVNDELTDNKSKDVQSSTTFKEEEDIGQEIIDKEEEPVYHLSLPRHDFFERDMLLTVQVYVKSLDKDAVKIVFSKQSFVLKFHTGDAKFLQLHEGTSAETTFSWAVTTRQKIVPEECKFKVKPSLVEITLRKTSSERWASLEAPSRKDKAQQSKSDSWMPINSTRSSSGTSTSITEFPVLSQASQLSPSMASAASGDIPVKNKSNVIFNDDLSDIDLRSKKTKSRDFVAPGYAQRQENNDTSYGDTDEKFQSNDRQIDSDNSLVGAGMKIKTQNVRLGNSETSFYDTDEKFKLSSLSQDWNKPMAKVHPLNAADQKSSAVIPPGFAGLVNLGNTCFMNCVLQVLSSTREFRDYFLDGRFQYEINEDNPLGMKGHLATTFGVLLRWLWSCKKYCWEPRKLKDLISKKNPQFFGYAQHDAHEFLAFLLDGLHEDLNRIRKKPYTETVDSNGRPDEEVAAEAWARYKQRNDSVVVDLFQGQYKSKLVCPCCGKVSITFDPFLYLSVPLPKKKKIIPVTFMWKESYKKPVRYQIQVSQDSTIEHLLAELSCKTNVSPKDMRAFEAYRGRIHKDFPSRTSLANVDVKDIIIVCEVLSEELAGEEVLEIPVIQRTLSPATFPFKCAFCHKPSVEGTSLKRCTNCYKVGYCDHTCQRNNWQVHKNQCNTLPEPIGCPFIISMPRSQATYRYLVQRMEEYSRFSVDVFQPPVRGSEGGGLKPQSSVPPSNLSSSLSQSCSSLNSLDSLSSASSTCTLTGDQSDPQTVSEAGEEGDNASLNTADSEQFVTPGPSSFPSNLQGATDVLTNTDAGDAVRQGSADSGLESWVSSKSSEKAVPMSQVMGRQATEVERDKATPIFFIKPVSMDGTGIKDAERLEDKGDQPLEMSHRRYLSMDWRNNEKLRSYVLVQSKELEAEEKDNINNIYNLNNKPSLYQCLELFTEPEILSPEEAWYCPSCKKHVEASKQMSIWRLPHTLVIQLKRFSFQNFLMRSKIKKHVDFPTRGLDLTSFCVGLHPDEPPPIYDLYGVANHHGLLIGGHYTAYSRCCGDNDRGPDEVGWRLCDDSRVSPIANEKSVVTADAYLLFYRQRGVRATIKSPPVPTNPAFSIFTPDQPGFSRSESASRQDMIYSSMDDDELNANSSSLPLQSRNAQHIYQEKNCSNEQGSSWRQSSPPSHASQMESQHDTGLAQDAVVQADALEETVEEKDGDLTEKVDKEKDFLGLKMGGAHLNATYSKDTGMEEDRNNVCDDEGDDDDDDDDDDDEGRGLVIDTSPDLGYTDMEAVD